MSLENVIDGVLYQSCTSCEVGVQCDKCHVDRAYKIAKAVAIYIKEHLKVVEYRR